MSRGHGKREALRLEREEVLLLRRIAAAVEFIALRLDIPPAGGMTDDEKARLERARSTLHTSEEALHTAVNTQPKES